MHDTASQVILILHDSGVTCKLHILDRELDHFSCPILLHVSSASIKLSGDVYPSITYTFIH